MVSILEHIQDGLISNLDFITSYPELFYSFIVQFLENNLTIACYLALWPSVTTLSKLCLQDSNTMLENFQCAINKLFMFTKTSMAVWLLMSLKVRQI
jgi:hypothetical protein